MGYDDEVPGIVKMKDDLEEQMLEVRLETLPQLRCKRPMLIETWKVVVELECQGPNHQ